MKNIYTKIGQTLSKNRLMKAITVATLLSITEETTYVANNYSQVKASTHSEYVLNPEQRYERDQELIKTLAYSTKPDSTVFPIIDSIYTIRAKTVNLREVKKIFEKTLHNTKIYSEIIDTATVRFVANQESGPYHNPYLISPYTHVIQAARALGQHTKDGWNTVDTSNYIYNVWDVKKSLVNEIRLLEWIEKYCAKNPKWETYDKQTKLNNIIIGYNAGIALLKDKDQKNWRDIEDIYQTLSNETKKYLAQLDSKLFKKELTQKNDTLENKLSTDSTTISLNNSADHY